MNLPHAIFEDGILRSARFGDIYFSTDGGLEETAAVFLGGCDLPARWRERAHFTLGELGFGSGLNMLAVADLWRRSRSPDARLHLFSIEGFPLTREQAATALAAFPQLAESAAVLLAQWPGGARGMHRIEWPDAGVTLDLAIADVLPALEGWDGRADAWFLDGFAPARNPEMWSDAVLATIAARTAPGARLATYTVAGQVRRGLEAHGFTVRRLPGFGRKRQRLEADFPGTPPTEAPRPTVAIIGAGISGAALALAFRDQGIEAEIFASGPMASGNPAALLSPRLDAGGGLPARLHAQCFHRAVDRITRTVPEAILRRGAIRLQAGPRDPARFAALLQSDLFNPGALAPVDMETAADQLGEASAPAGLRLADALAIDPHILRAAWLGQTVRADRIDRIEPLARGFALYAGATLLTQADIVCIAAGPGSPMLGNISLRSIRGQASAAAMPLPGAAATWGHYCIPMPGGLLFGATHDRDDTDIAIRAEDHARNLQTLAAMRPALAAQLAAMPLTGYAGTRVAPRDTQPVAGRLASGVHILTGLGGRGFALAPLLAEHVAAQALGLPSPLPASSARLVDPGRLEG